jgi:hypothetical protein
LPDGLAVFGDERNLMDIPPVASVDPTLLRHAMARRLHHRRWRETSTVAAELPLTMAATR